VYINETLIFLILQQLEDHIQTKQGHSYLQALVKRCIPVHLPAVSGESGSATHTAEHTVTPSVEEIDAAALDFAVDTIIDSAIAASKPTVATLAYVRQIIFDIAMFNVFQIIGRDNSDGQLLEVILREAQEAEAFFDADSLLPTESASEDASVSGGSASTSFSVDQVQSATSFPAANAYVRWAVNWFNKLRSTDSSTFNAFIADFERQFEQVNVAIKRLLTTALTDTFTSSSKKIGTAVSLRKSTKTDPCTQNKHTTHTLGILSDHQKSK
jgi:hypothetical protein